MDVIVERCAGLDVHRDSVVATVRVPGMGKEPPPARAADAHLRHHDRAARAARRLAAGLRRHAGRDGGDRCLLEAGLLGARAAVRVLADQRRAPPQRARAEERRDRLALAVRAARARARPAELRAATRDPPPARPDPAAQHPGRGAHTRNPAAREGTARRGDQTEQRRLQDLLGLGTGDTGGAARRRQRPRLPLSSSPRAGCGRRSRSSARRWPTASTPPTTASSSPACSPTSTRSTRQSPRSTPASPPPPTQSRSNCSPRSPASSVASPKC
jgi:hypothetical protein